MIYTRLKDQPLTVEEISVTLLTHCSLGDLTHLSQLIKSWDGPFSVSVFVDLRFDEFQLILKGFTVCNFDYLSHVTFHVVKPLKQSTGPKTHDEEFLQAFKDFDYRKIYYFLRDLQNIATNHPSHVAYPVNLLRNVAWYGSRTEYVFSTDIDMIPSKNLQHMFLKFAKLNQESRVTAKTAYVVPLFEISASYFRETSRYFPIDKNTLLRLLKCKLLKRPVSWLKFMCNVSCTFIHKLFSRWKKVEKHVSKERRNEIIYVSVTQKTSNN